MAYEISQHYLDHLAGQFELARPVLFTGAGFSRDASNFDDKKLPSVSELKGVLWNICFPGDAYDSSASLTNLYETAASRHSKKLTEALQRLLTVKSESLPDWYKQIFSFPWAKCYTLNIDDLPMAVARRFDLSRTPRPISALDPSTAPGDEANALRNLLVIHLNGIKDDLPDRVTFSQTQYAERLARNEPWYLTLVAELLTRPFVFIGTTLDEPPLWQHIELRQHRGGAALRELRPRSYLVTPSLDRAKEALLSEHNFVWIPLTGEQFVNEVLTQITGAAAKGSALIAERLVTSRRTRPVVAEVAALATNPLEKTEYLLGAEPVWADIQSGRAVVREIDADLEATVSASMSKAGTKGVILISGTAGAGKSTALMRVCLSLSAKGTRVAWIDRTSDMPPRAIRDAMSSDSGPVVLAIDDADLFGSELSPLSREVCSTDRAPLVLLAIRSGRVERVINPNLLRKVSLVEKSVPNLVDKEISSLLDALDKENRLGSLKGKPRDEQVRIFQQYCGRQLLVAMIRATSNDRFEEKAVTEFKDLLPESRVVYGLVAVASSFRFGLTRDEIVVGAGGDASNLVLNHIDQLVRRHILVTAPSGELMARHRVIADIVSDELRRSGILLDILIGLSLIAASKVTPQLSRSSRPWRMLIGFMNHDYLARSIGPENARNLYGSLEGILNWDYHFWLQRGSLEVESGTDLSLAENFLNQALSLRDDDPFLQTEYAYFQFRKAGADPRNANAPDLVQDATDALRELILKRGEADAYPYHVLGSQGLMWARRGIIDPKQKELYLREVLVLIKDGMSKHAHRSELRQLHDDLQKEILSIAVVR